MRQRNSVGQNCGEASGQFAVAVFKIPSVLKARKCRARLLSNAWKWQASAGRPEALPKLSMDMSCHSCSCAIRGSRGMRT
eukprot:8433549-Pyramimonas_sp.AAC.1